MKYTVTLARRRYDYAEVVVEAESSLAAEKAAWEVACEGDTDWLGEETEAIYPIESKEFTPEIEEDN